MSEEITEEIAESYLRLRSVDGGATAIQQRLGFYPDHYRCQAYCEGYLKGVEDKDAEIKALKEDAEGLVEVLKMAVIQTGKRTRMLKTEGGEEIEALLIPSWEVRHVLDQFRARHPKEGA